MKNPPENRNGFHGLEKITESYLSSFWIWEGCSLQSSAKEKVFSGATQDFQNKIQQNPSSLLSKWNIPCVHLEFSSKYPSFVPTFLWIEHNSKREHPTTENTEIMVIHDNDSTKRINESVHIELSDFLNEAAATYLELQTVQTAC